VRAYQPRPGPTSLEGNILKNIKRSGQRGCKPDVGEHAILDKRPALGTSSGWLVLDEVQPAGKKPMSGQVFLNGAHNGFLRNA